MKEGQFREIVYQGCFPWAGSGGKCEAGEEIVACYGGDAEGEGFNDTELEVGELFFGEGFSGHVCEFFKRWDSSFFEFAGDEQAGTPQALQLFFGYGYFAEGAIDKFHAMV